MTLSFSLSKPTLPPQAEGTVGPARSPCGGKVCLCDGTLPEQGSCPSVAKTQCEGPSNPAGDLSESPGSAVLAEV